VDVRSIARELTTRAVLALAVCVPVLSLTGCGSAARHAGRSGVATSVVAARAVTPPTPATRPRALPSPEAIVAAESENRLVLVNLRSGRVIRGVPLPADPEYIAADRRVIVAVSAGAGAVTVLARSSLRRIREVTGFGSPHIPLISPSGAHHISISPDGRALWIALGQSASRIAVVNSSDPARPRLVGSFEPGFLAHAVVFTPDGRRVWISSASGPDVGVFSAVDHRLLFRVPGGSPPQHIAFAGSSAYLTSGYGSTIERVSLAAGRVLRRVSAPYGSFELDAGSGFVVTSSLFRGTLSIYDYGLDLERTLSIAPATEDVVISPS
jgi:DNA-binding beta-propeller fold protein YncE